MGQFEVTRGDRVFQIDASGPDEAGQKADAIVGTPAAAAQDAPASPGPTSWLPGGETLGDATQSVGSGIPWSDEILAGAATPFRVGYNAATGADAGKSIYDRIGGAYNTEVAHERQLQSDAAKRSPIASTIGSTLGGIVSLGGPGEASLAATAAERMAAARTAAVAAPAAKTMLGRSVNAGLQTGAYGALYGSGEGQGLEDRAWKGLGGGLVGTAFGAGMNPLAEGAVKLGSDVIAPRLRSVFAPKDEAGNRLGIAIGRDQGVAAETGSSLPDRGLTDQEFAAAQARGTPVMNMDRGGTTVRDLADAAAIASPTARGILHQALNDRHITQFPRFEDELNNMVHGKGSVAAIDELQGAARVQNKGAYGIAEAHPNAQAMWNGDLQNLLKSDEMKKAVKGAISTSTNRVALDRNGIAVRHPFAVDSGTGGLTLKPLTDEQATASGAIPGTRPMPNLPFWDEVKKNLDGAIGIYQRAGNNPAAADAIGLKNSLLTHLDSMVPPYKAARQGAASFAKAKDAVEAGQNLVNDSTIGVDDAFKMRLKMKPAEREMTKIGIVDALKKKLGNQKDAADLTRSFLTAPNARSKIGMFLGPDNMNTLLRARGEEATMAVNKNAVQGNSKTVQRAVQSGLVGLGGGVLYGAAGDHSPYDIGAASLATGLTAALGRHASNKFTERMSVEIARKLVSGSRDAFASAQRTLANNPKLIATVRSLGVPLSLIGIHETVGN